MTEKLRRRDILARFGAAGAAALLPALMSNAARAADSNYKPRRIDVHHHVLPPAYLDWEKLGKATFRTPLDISKWSLQGCIDDMDKYGIATAIVSSPDLNGNMPGDWLDVVRSCNEWMAGLGRDHPGRFGSFSMLPLPNVDACLKEVSYALDTLHADGMRAAPSYNGKYLGHADFQPVWDELNRRKAVMFVHPTQPQCCAQIVPNAPSATLEFPFDTTRAVTDLLLSGTFSRHPDIRWIFSHGGGTLPMLAGRISGTASFNPKVAANMPNGPIYELKRLYVDTASAYFPYSWAGMMQLFGPRKILFGTDDPYIKVAQVDAGLAALELGKALRAAVDRENALPLFPRLRRV